VPRSFADAPTPTPSSGFDIAPLPLLVRVHPGYGSISRRLCEVDHALRRLTGGPPAPCARWDKRKRPSSGEAEAVLGFGTVGETARIDNQPRRRPFPIIHFDAATGCRTAHSGGDLR
jgi:hypothetical protein